jgi:hypothetical protein
MNAMINSNNHSKRSIPRSQFIDLVRSALSVNATRFARRATLSWLAAYPGDLEANLLYAQALSKLNAHQQALPVLQNLCLADPEYLEAQEALYKVHQVTERNIPAQVRGSVFALGGKTTSSYPIPVWAKQLRQVYNSLDQGKLKNGEELIHQALLIEPLPPLVAVAHLRFSAENGLPVQGMRDLANFYHERWPTCLPFTLYLAEALMTLDDHSQGVHLLHQAAAQDVKGQVATRLWGRNHPYQVVYPDRMEILLDVPIPSEVSVLLGWNRLTEGEKANQVHQKRSSRDFAEFQSQDESVSSVSEKGSRKPNDARQPKNKPYSIPESLHTVHSELEKVAARLKRKYLTQADGRFPVYVIFTTRQGLLHQYGEGIKSIDAELKRLASAVEARLDWGSIIVYADDKDNMRSFNLEPVNSSDAWGLKLALTDLDSALATRGEMIGAVLIVGGPEIVPFHHLPNPVDDSDLDVPSDNPYTTRDENYFVPEWAVGRLPCVSGRDPQPLLDALRKMSLSHNQVSKPKSWVRRWLGNALTRLFRWVSRKRPSYGFTAAIWKRAAFSVFRPIGNPQSMLISPPVQANGKKRKKFLPSANLGYFNLHGLPDSGEWYGQRDPTEPTDDPDYPVAMRIQDVVNSGHAPQVVFSEACYGAHVLGKSLEDALCLKFLASGSRVVVGSTCTAYGSITTPLIGADLLGHVFWKFLRDGYPAGEALHRAKIHLAREMLNRQGYLDGEDQKTLISFILYGDPMAHITNVAVQSKSIYRPLQQPTVIKTVCDRTSSNGECQLRTVPPPIPEETLASVKKVVEQYLPGMKDAQISCNQPHIGCTGSNHSCPTSQSTSRSNSEEKIDRRVVTLSKKVEKKNGKSPQTVIHQHYARLTLDSKYKVIKMAVSR